MGGSKRVLVGPRNGRWLETRDTQGYEQSVEADMSVARVDPGRPRREMVRRPSFPVLRMYVRGYCGYFEGTTALSSRVEFPSGSVGLIVGLGPAVEVAYPAHCPGSTAHVTSFVAGLHDCYAVAKATGWQQGVQIELTSPTKLQ